MSEQDQNNIMNEVTLNEKNFEVLVARFIPTSQYFERSFEMLQSQINGLREGQKDLKADFDKRFELTDRRFEQIDRRFEQIDRRFDQIDKRFDQINNKLDTIIERMDVKIDAGLRENRNITIRLFSFAMVFSAISMAGLLAKMTGLF